MSPGGELLDWIGGQPGTANLLWGGFLSCLSEFTIVGGLVAMYRKQACHDMVRVPLAGWHVRCWRLGHHQVEGTPYKACRKHHPALPDKARPGDIRRAYDKAREG